MTEERLHFCCESSIITYCLVGQYPQCPACGAEGASWDTSRRTIGGIRANRTRLVRRLSAFMTNADTAFPPLDSGYASIWRAIARGDL